MDGHHKPVYSDKLVPRGMVGKFGKVMGCRGLTLLHDHQGHPLLVITGRGDTHLTLGLPQIVQHYEQALLPLNTPAQTSIGATPTPSQLPKVGEVVADREIMAANFLAGQLHQNRSFITLLDVAQYQGLSSFEEVGEFVPLEYDRQGKLVKEVAAAKFELKLPHNSAKSLRLNVALVRDYRRQQPLPAQPEMINRPARSKTKTEDIPPPNPAAGIVTKAGSCGRWENGWEAAPTPSSPTQARLIPIVTTGTRTDPLELVELYRRRWQCQENIFKDWLLPLGLDTNHGFASQPVINSSVKRQREKLEQHLTHLQARTLKTRQRLERSSQLRTKYIEQHRILSKQLEKASVECQFELERQGLNKYEVKDQMDERLAVLRSKCRRLRELQAQHYSANYQENQKLAQQCAKQSQLLGALDELQKRERPMVELENGKDQIMSVLKVALANLGMWLRDNYFGASYANCSWGRMLAFFKLGGWVSSTKEGLKVVLEGFKERKLNRELVLVCEKLVAAPLQLADGRYLKVELAEKVKADLELTTKTKQLSLAS